MHAALLTSDEPHNSPTVFVLSAVVVLIVAPTVVNSLGFYVVVGLFGEKIARSIPRIEVREAIVSGISSLTFKGWHAILYGVYRKVPKKKAVMHRPVATGYNTFDSNDGH
jgi:single-stranded DNA-specific DHH superfamily exonuclease